MPTRPPYPREARIVAVEKGATGQTVRLSPGISCVPTTRNPIR